MQLAGGTIGKTNTITMSEIGIGRIKVILLFWGATQRIVSIVIFIDSWHFQGAVKKQETNDMNDFQKFLIFFSKIINRSLILIKQSNELAPPGLKI